MATCALIHGAADSAWYWHLVEGELRDRGQDVVAVDLPCEDGSAGWSEYADTVVEASPIAPTSSSSLNRWAGFTAPIVCDRVAVHLLVLVAGMVPLPGETGNESWTNTGYEQAAREADHDGDEIALFLHDVPPELAAERTATAARRPRAGCAPLRSRGSAGPPIRSRRDR
jgi:hypothetical protein